MKTILNFLITLSIFLDFNPYKLLSSMINIIVFHVILSNCINSTKIKSHEFIPMRFFFYLFFI